MKAIDPMLFQPQGARTDSRPSPALNVTDIRRIAGSETQRWRGTFMSPRGVRPGTTVPFSSRIEQVCGKWFYQTREGTTEGPFDTREAAQFSLDGYLLIVGSKAFDQHSLDAINSLSLEPLDTK